MDRAMLRRLLLRGHGRALFYLRRHPGGMFDEIIEEACCRDSRCDRYSDLGRALYLYEAVQTSPNAVAVLARTWGTLEATEPGYDQHQMLEIAGICAERGSLTAKAVLWRVFERNCREGDLGGYEEVLRCDGAAAYRKALQCVAASPAEFDLERDLWRFDYRCTEGLKGDETALRILEESAAESTLIAKVAVHVASREALAKPARRIKTAQPTYEEIRKDVAKRSRRWLWNWGRAADEDSLAQAAADLTNAKNGNTVWALLHIFWCRPFPGDPEVLLKFAQGRAGDRRRAAVRALSHVQHPAVRALALKCMADRSRLSEAVEMLVANYEPEDADALEKVLRSLRSEYDFHSIGRDVRQMAEAATRPDLLPCLRILFEKTNCSLCRGGAVHELRKLGAFPPEWEDEFGCDSHEITSGWR